MRLLFLMRGNCGSGKSTFIADKGLTDFTLSADEYRIRMAGLELQADGSYCISQAKNSAVFKQLKTDLESRMEQGQTTVVDATNTRASDMADYIKIAKKYRYRVVVVDFSAVPTEECKRRNAERLPEYKRVSNEVIDKFAERLAQGLPLDFKPQVIAPDEFDSFVDGLFIDDNLEAADYTQVIAVGDIHGCYDALAQALLTALGLWEDGLAIPTPTTLAANIEAHSTTKFVFTGDYIDRGIQHKEVVDFLYAIHNLRNVKLLLGNHEHNVEREMRGENISRYSETVRTLRTLENASTPDNDYVKKLRVIVRKCGLMYSFWFGSEHFVCAHNAISTLPRLCTPANVFFKGCGDYEDSRIAERAFINRNGYRMSLIHGHRNVNLDPILAEATTTHGAYNLCDTVEHGGMLRVLRLRRGVDSGYQRGYTAEPIVVKNNVYRKPVALTENVEIVTQLLNSPDIHIKELDNGIRSLNFKRDVFYNNRFNALNCKARGLYLYEDGAICARGYDKFFNAWSAEQVRGDEKHDHEFGDFALADLPKKGIVFPIQASEKTNGFLGLVSYNKMTDDFFIATKSQDYGDFADWFREIIKPYLTDALKHDLKYLNSTAIFEVVDPVRDPHIIRYNRADVVLLDVVENSFETKFLHEAEFVVFASVHNFEHKDIMRWHVRDVSELTALLQDLAKHGRNEGYVIRDARGYMFKVKTDYYSFWKGLRPALEALQSGKSTSGRSCRNPQQLAVIKWMRTNMDMVRSAKSIMDIRDAYLAQTE